VEISDPVPFLLEAGKRKTHLPLLIETTNLGTIPKNGDAILRVSFFPAAFKGYVSADVKTLAGWETLMMRPAFLRSPCRALFSDLNIGKALRKC
jgi:hypothetical protein